MNPPRGLWGFTIRVLAVTRFVWALEALAVAALALSDQGRDLIATMAVTGGQVWVFLGASLFFALSAWYAARQSLDICARALDAVRPERPWSRWLADRVESWMPRLYGCAVFVAVGLFALDLSGRFDPAGELRGGLRTFAFGNLATAAGLAFLLWLRRRALRRLGYDRSHESPTPGAWVEDRRHAHVLRMLGMSLGALGVTAALVVAGAEHWAPLLGPATVAFLWFGLVIPVGQALAVWGSLARFPALAVAVVGLMVLSAIGNLYPVRRLEGGFAAAPPAPAESDSGCLHRDGSSPASPLARYACRWAMDRVADRPGGSSYPVVLVSAEGGGIRAALWTAAVLAALQDRHPAFARHVFAMSGASGGSLGIATVAALLAAPQAPGPLAPRVRTLLDRDFLSPVLAGFLFMDTLRPALRVFGSDDRSGLLERSWELAWADAGAGNPFAADFDALWRGPAPPPLLLLNATQVHDGRRAVVLPSLVREAAPDGLLAEFGQAADVLGAVGGPIRLSTAIGLSARFPIVTPVGNVDRDGRRRQFADGGYFDNSATLTLRDVAARLPERVRRADDATVRLVPVVLHLINDPEQAAFDRDPGRSVPEAASFAGAQALGPLAAITSTRSARSYFARDLVRREIVGRGDGGCFLVAALSPPAADAAEAREVPLGWTLSPGVRAHIHDAAAAMASGGSGTESARLAAFAAALVRPGWQGCPAPPTN